MNLRGNKKGGRKYRDNENVVVSTTTKTSINYVNSCVTCSCDERKGFRGNSCIKCKLWVHNKCLKKHFC